MDERIDIEVIDKVAKTIRPELLGISAAAKNAHNEIAKLKRALGVSGVSGMASATKGVAAAERDATRASRERAAQARATATALDKEAAAQSRLAAVAARASRTTVRQAAGPIAGGNANWKADAKAQTDFMRNFGAETRRVAVEAERTTTATARLGTNINNVGKQSGLARHHLLNLGFQLQDIFVSLASGQKPLTVFIQQGGQIGQIAAQSGVGIAGMAKAIGGMLLRFLPAVAAVGAGVSAFALFNREVSKGIDTKAMIDSLGLTRKEIKKLENTTVTWGDVTKSTFRIVGQDIAAAWGVNMSNVKSIFINAMDGITEYGAKSLAALYASFAGTRAYLAEIEKGGIGGIATGKSFEGLIEKTYGKEYKSSLDYLKDLRKRITKDVADTKRADLQAQAAEIKLDRTPKKPKGAKGFDRAKELREVNAELDEQIKLSRLYGDELERQTQIEQINQTFRKNGVGLTDAERAGLLAKIDLIKENKRVQEQMNAILDDIKKPLDDYDASIEAINRLLADTKIGHDEANRQMAIAKERMLAMTNPMLELNRAQQDRNTLLKYYGKELEIQTLAQQKYNEAVRANPALRDDPSLRGKKLADAASEIAANDNQSMYSDLESQYGTSSYGKDRNAYILDNYKSLMAAIDQERNGDVERERIANDKKRLLDRAYNDARLDYTQTALGNLSDLQNSHVREVAAIGKAAAIAQATIDGIRAVQAALAGPPGPPWSYAIAATTGISAAANVAKIAGIGFMKGGYTGDMPTNAVAGAVHGREYVMDAAATARIGVPALEALRSGRLNPGPANDNKGAKVTVINNGSDQVTVRERSDGELMVMIDKRMDAKFDKTMQRKMSDPNSGASKSVGNNFRVQRKR